MKNHGRIRKESPALQIDCILALQNYQRGGKVTYNTEQSQVQQNNVQLNQTSALQIQNIDNMKKIRH